MIKKTTSTFLAIVKRLAVAFFFSILILTVMYVFCYDKVTLYISLINKNSVEIKASTNDNVKIDNTSNTLINYPSYGTIFATISIPVINVEAPVYHGDTLDLLKYGVGHYAGSYFPGEGKTVILAAHNSKEHFMYLPKLKENDLIYISTIYKDYTYQVTNYKIIADNDIESLKIQKDQEILIMYTCYPVNTIGHKNKRYVVYAKKVGE